MSGIERIAAERRRQVEAEGWSPEHDDDHDNFELSRAACCYGQMGAGGPYSNPTPGQPPPGWPWDVSWWKPDADPVRNLEKAGALFAAEIDRLLRKRGDHAD